MLPFVAECSARMCGGEDKRDLLHRVTHHQHPLLPSGELCRGRGQSWRWKTGSPLWKNPAHTPHTPPLPLSCLHSWAEEEEGGRGERAKREQVGTRDGVFAQEPCVSHFLSLPELIG